MSALLLGQVKTDQPENRNGNQMENGEMKEERTVRTTNAANYACTVVQNVV